MKRFSKEHINQMTIEYLSNRNYSRSDFKHEKMRTKHESLIEMAMRGRAGGGDSNPGVVSVSVGRIDLNTKAEESFRKFISFSNKSPEPFKSQLCTLHFPLFAHIFIELFQSGHLKKARGFCNDNKSRFKENSELKPFIDSMNLSINSQSLDSKLKDLNKCVIKLTQDCFNYFKIYLMDCHDAIIIYLLQHYIEVQLYQVGYETDHESMTMPFTLSSSSLHSQSQMNSLSTHQITNTTNSNEKHPVKSPSSSPLTTTPSVASIPVSESQDSSSSKVKLNVTKESLMKVIDKLSSPQPQQYKPSIAFYGIKNCDLCCVDVSQDSFILAAGLESSQIALWNLNGDKVCHKESVYKMKTDITQLDLALEPALRWEDEDEDVDMNVGERRENGINEAKCDTQLGDVGKESELSKPMTMRGHGGPVYGLSFLYKTNILLSCSEDTTVRAWDLNLHKNVCIYDGHNSPIWCIDSSIYNNYFITGSKDTSVKLWSLDRIHSLRDFNGHTMDVECVKFHANCNYIATGSADKTVRFWDINSCRMIRSFVGHQGAIHCLSFSPDGKLLASVGEDRKVKVWDITGGGLLKEFEGHTDTIYHVGFNLDGSIIATCGLDRYLKLWRLNPQNNNNNLLETSANNYSNKSSPSSDQIASYHFKVNSLIHCSYTGLMPRNLLLTIGQK